MIETRIRIACIAWLLAACGGDVPSLERARTAQAADTLPDWIAYPETLPAGVQGTNNCTFAFGQDVPQWDFHPDAGCWERPGPDGWTRQQFYRIHVPRASFCKNKEGDATAIRVCRNPGEPNPCFINELTGPSGCAICVADPV